MKASRDYQRVLGELAHQLRGEGRDDDADAVELARRAWIFGQTRVNSARSILRTLAPVLSSHLLDDLRRLVCAVDDFFPDDAGHMRERPRVADRSDWSDDG